MQPARKPSSHEEGEDWKEGVGGRTGEPRVLVPGLLGIARDMTQKPFLIPLGPHVLLDVNSVHTQPSFRTPCTSPEFLPISEP